MKAKLSPPGSTYDRPIVLAAGGSDEGIRTDDAHLNQMFRNRSQLLTRLLARDAERSYDVMVAQVGRRTETAYFDITSFMPPKEHR